MTTLTEQLTATKASTAAQLPPEIAAAFTAQQAKLSVIETPIVPLGREVPDATLLSATGQATLLSEVLDGAPAVLVFYRGDWCPYCNLALRTYRAELLPQLDTLGWKLVAISPQRPDGSLSTQEAAELTFAVLSDPKNALADSVGIVDDGTDEARAAQAALGLDLAAVNEGGDIRLPMPAVVLVDGQRRVRWADVHPDYTIRTDVEAVVKAINSL